MIEHRLIEKMLRIVEARSARMRATGAVDAVFVDTAVDFIRTYADRTHHGKEEDILFKELEAADLEERDAREMRGLIDEHVQARAKVKALVEAKERFLAGERDAFGEVLQALDWLTAFYPRHIAKEDRSFFPRTERYFTREELDAMLQQFWEFDRRMIHEKYEALVKGLGDR
jgi:hemerythrin-like domain-containing protein